MAEWSVPKVYQHFLDDWAQHRENLLKAYQSQQLSFVPNLLPEQAVQFSAKETLEILRHRLGGKLDDAVAHAEPEHAPSLVPASPQSPVAGEMDGSWLKRSNMVGINIRTVGSFWNVIKYILTISEIQDSIHLLPIWEPGVVGSLYGISSWNINQEFYSEEMAEIWPELDTVERQLKTVVNLLHAMNKAVGMDVIPHTDRFSEIVLAHPQYFEWLQREGTEIFDHADNLHEEVQDRILEFLAANGPAISEEIPRERGTFFSPDFPEDRRLRILFGHPRDRQGRSARRNKLVRHLYTYGYEPVPATMAPPFRGLQIDPETRYTDSQGNVWYDYRISEPQSMSRVFGPLTRYKLYGRLDNNINWGIDFANPRREVWSYVCEKYYGFQRRYGFDFMRGDMSHVQMRPDGVPEIVDGYYDILGAVKAYIQREKGVRHFGYFAETFLAGRNIMVYGDEVDHLEASGADTTLGDLQSTAVGSLPFLQRFRQYYDLLTARSFAPTFTVMTGDKDDPRFDEYYLKGNALRLFIAFFLADMPSYVALGFETRDIHHLPAANEYYTKLYVFQETSGPKATFGPYQWGRNGALFHTITRLKLYAETVLPQIKNRPTQWLICPDPTGENKHLAWTQKDASPNYVFVANTDTERHIENFDIPTIPNSTPHDRLSFEFSTVRDVPAPDRTLIYHGRGYRVHLLAAGEGRVYRLVRQKPG
jgi:hypothetical protein